MGNSIERSKRGMAKVVLLQALDQLCEAVSILASVNETIPDLVDKVRRHWLPHMTSTVFPFQYSSLLT
jgi:hypothetical protein